MSKDPYHYHYQYRIACIVLFNLLLSACATSMESPPIKRAMCAQLKSDIILHPSTGDERVEEIQRAQEFRQAYDYDVQCQNVS